MAPLILQTLRRWWLVVSVLLLAGCASAPPALAPSPAPLLHDALFGHPARPGDADSVFAVDAAMRAHVRQALPMHVRSADRPLALAESLERGRGLALSYDASTTRNASQAFAARAGNCLSLVVMTAALAREAGLEVSFQQAQGNVLVTRADDFILRSGHVNVVLGPRLPRQGAHNIAAQMDSGRLQIDFLPQDELQGLRMVPIGEERVLAMFANNRAVEALVAQRLTEAYAWVREAIRHDAAYWPAYNTLGVVYQRAGHLSAATASFERTLDHEPRNLAAIGNFALVLKAQGRLVEAAQWDARRLALEPFAPGHFLQQGLVALGRGDADAASQHFNREVREHGPSPDVWLGLARVHLLRGELPQAEKALGQAVDASASPVERVRYATKLDALRAAGMPLVRQ